MTPKDSRAIKKKIEPQLKRRKTEKRRGREGGRVRGSNTSSGGGRNAQRKSRSPYRNEESPTDLDGMTKA